MKVLIAGQGISGRSAFDYLLKNGYNVEYFKSQDLNIELNVSNKEYIDRLLSGLSFIVVSPGISLDNNLIKEAKKRKISVIGELELGTRNIKENIIAVTGTNGKTTTVSLINHMLKDYRHNVFLGGNVGVAVTSFCDRVNNNDIVILECSSYQLETINKFHAHIACILNFSEDHLLRHKTMKNYIKVKNNIVRNQSDKDYLILNYDNDLVMKNIPKTKAKLYYFSIKTKVNGCYIKKQCIYFNDNQKEIKLLSIKNVKLVGNHNLSNILCACLAVYLQTRDIDLLTNILTFEGVAHRNEFVKSINGIAFYNDSKATNIDSTIVALKSYKCGINLILGGSDKGYEFDFLFENMPKNVKNIVIFGQTRQKIVNAAKKYNYKNYYVCENLKAATHLCFTLSKPKDIVLLSPACASFDFFNNFEERGNFFKKIVEEIAFSESSYDNKKV